MMDTYDNALIMGLGASGEAAAALLLSEGANVTIADAADHPTLRGRAERLAALGARVHLGVEALPEGAYDIAVVSPGLRMDAPWVLEAWHRGLPLVSELELGWSRRRCPVVAVTGSNGKSTTVKLLCHILTRAGLRAAPAGNYGPAISSVVRDETLDWMVVEVSSFQLEWSEAFRAEVGILLNVQPNHLDRHGTMQNYLSIKARMFSHTGRGDVCLAPTEFGDTVRGLSQGGGQWFTFGAGDTGALTYKNGRILREGAVLADISGTRFANDIMGPSLAAVYGAAEACGIRPQAVTHALDSFEPLPHRMQSVGSWGGVEFIDDSKSTTLSSLAAALCMSPPGVRLIAGGVLKEHDLFGVKEQLAERTAGVYLIGRSAQIMFDAWSDEAACDVCGDLETAVARAAADARDGETVLLSPGCASFDQFGNFEERGRRFVALVRDRLRDVPEDEMSARNGIRWTEKFLGVR